MLTRLLNLPDVAVVAWDTETSGLYSDDGATVACVAVAWYDENDERQSRAFSFDQGTRDKFPQSQMDLFESNEEDPNLGQAEWDELMKWLASRKLLVGHNAMFDILLTDTGTRHFPGVNLVDRPVFDTMIASRELDPLKAASLDSASRRAGLPGKAGLEAILDWNKANAARLRKMGCKKPLKRYDLAPWSVASPYVTVDAELTIGLFRAQVRRMGSDAAVTAEIKRQFKVMKVLTKLEQRGIGYDGKASLAAAHVLEERSDELAAKLPFAPTRAGAMAWFCEKHGLQTDRVSDITGDPSLDAEQMRKWASEGVEWAKEYALVAKMRRTSSMHYRGYAEKLGADGRLRTRFRQGTVRSGRLACERCNVQAIPKADKTVDGVPDVKKLMVPKPGCGLWSLDLSQAELRVASKYAQCKLMLAELASDDPDIHGKTTEKVLHAKRTDADWRAKRDIGKRVGFSSIFVCGADTMQATLSKEADIFLPRDEVQAIITGWHKLYPEFRAAKKITEQRVTQRGYARILPNTPYEGKSWFGVNDEPHTGWSRLVQGSLSRAFMLLLVGTEDRWPGRLVLTVHDSLVLEMKEDEGDRIAAEICAYAAELLTPLFSISMSMDSERVG